VIVVTFGGLFSPAKGAITVPAYKVRHFAERLVCDGSGAIAYLDRYVGCRTRSARTMIGTDAIAWCAAQLV
jgi:hypothetical protein